MEVGVADEPQAGLVDERQPDVIDHEVDAREVARSAVHVPGLGVLDHLRQEREPLCTPIRLTPRSWIRSKTGEATFGSSIRHGIWPPSS